MCTRGGRSRCRASTGRACPWWAGEAALHVGHMQGVHGVRQHHVQGTYGWATSAGIFLCSLVVHCRDKTGLAPGRGGNSNECCQQRRPSSQLRAGTGQCLTTHEVLPAANLAYCRSEHTPGHSEISSGHLCNRSISQAGLGGTWLPSDGLSYNTMSPSWDFSSCREAPNNFPAAMGWESSQNYIVLSTL